MNDDTLELRAIEFVVHGLGLWGGLGERGGAEEERGEGGAKGLGDHGADDRTLG